MIVQNSAIFLHFHNVFAFLNAMFFISLSTSKLSIGPNYRSVHLRTLSLHLHNQAPAITSECPARYFVVAECITTSHLNPMDSASTVLPKVLSTAKALYSP
jgi:hypothetical protein